MKDLKNIERYVGVLNGVTFIGTIISLFLDSWKFTVILLLAFVFLSDLFTGIQATKSNLSTGIEDMMGSVMSSMNINQEDETKENK